MGDLELTKLCAEAWSGDSLINYEGKIYFVGNDGSSRMFDPLHDDAQAFALMRKFALAVWGADFAANEWKWHAEIQHFPDGEKPAIGHGDTPNRAIVQCVARMTKAKQESGEA